MTVARAIPVGNQVHVICIIFLMPPINSHAWRHFIPTISFDG